MWDIIACWPSARVGEVVTITCPPYFSYFSDHQKGNFLYEGNNCFVAKKPKDAIAGLRSAVLSLANTFIYSFITVSIFIFKRLFAYS